MKKIISIVVVIACCSLIEPIHALDCPEDSLECSNGSSVFRNPMNECRFFGCPKTTEQDDCLDDARVCPDGTPVTRDINNGCAFFPCKEADDNTVRQI